MKYIWPNLYNPKIKVAVSLDHIMLCTNYASASYKEVSGLDEKTKSEVIVIAES